MQAPGYCNRLCTSPLCLAVSGPSHATRRPPPPSSDCGVCTHTGSVTPNTTPRADCAVHAVNSALSPATGHRLVQSLPWTLVGPSRAPQPPAPQPPTGAPSPGSDCDTSQPQPRFLTTNPQPCRYRTAFRHLWLWYNSMSG